MNCPVCKRELAPSLSICPSCGAMMNDSVREELETQIKRPGVRPSLFEQSPVPSDVPPEPIVQSQMVFEASVRVIDAPPSAEVPKKKVITTELVKDTSPTLVDFQNRNSSLPDWRLELQNSIRKRNGGTAISSTSVSTNGPAGSTAVAMADPTALRSDKVANALKRIEESRRLFASGQAAGAAAAAVARARKPATQSRSFPFDVVERKEPAKPVGSKTVAAPTKPKLVATPAKKTKFDTNKLPPIPEPEAALPETTSAEPGLFGTASEPNQIKRFDRMRIEIEAPVETPEIIDDGYEEIDDLAPMSMRFGAAVFDLIIGVFAAAILLSPFLFAGPETTSLASFLALGGAALLVMFLYLTASIGFAGRTVGMKLFSLEIIDAEANELPTLHQAAVNSAVYLLSLIFVGVGILPAFFNEEHRAAHDLLSGTILIREYQ